jgi:hypothetical protein
MIITRRSLVQAAGAAVAVLGMPAVAVAATRRVTPKMNLTSEEGILVCRFARERKLGQHLNPMYYERVSPESFEKVSYAFFVYMAYIGKRFWLGHTANDFVTSRDKAIAGARKLNVLSNYDFSPFIEFGSPDGTYRTSYTLSPVADPEEFRRAADTIAMEIIMPHPYYRSRFASGFDVGEGNLA